MKCTGAIRFSDRFPQPDAKTRRQTNRINVYARQRKKQINEINDKILKISVIGIIIQLNFILPHRPEHQTRHWTAVIR